jgi:ribA/ribD-fused uncharacterized protein
MAFKERFIFFWDGPFSNWYYCDFEVNGIRYNCSEQYMMAEKARFFGDKGALALIMSSDTPREQKAIGRTVQNFDEKKWNEVAKRVVYKGCHAKFTQNEKLKEQLLNTYDAEFVEASPTDCIWGVGLRQSDPKILDRKNWRGKNWLGEVLTNLRDNIREENNISDKKKEINDILDEIREGINIMDDFDILADIKSHLHEFNNERVQWI